MVMAGQSKARESNPSEQMSLSLSTAHVVDVLLRHNVLLLLHAFSKYLFGA